MRGLQRSPHVTTTIELPAESTLVSILYLQQPEHPAGGSAHCTGGEGCTVQGRERLYTILFRGQAGQSSTSTAPPGDTTGVS